MQRPACYITRQGDAVLACLESAKDAFMTAAQISEHLQKEQIAVSRPTIYRQLEKLVNEGRARKYVFGDTSVASFQYIAPGDKGQRFYHMKCESCDGVFNLKCDEVGHVSRHILEDHEFLVNDKKTVFYGKCKKCLQNE